MLIDCFGLAAVLREMARELLVEKIANSSATLTEKCSSGPNCRRTRSTSSSNSHRQYLVVDGTSEDEFRTYHKFSPDAGRSHGRGREDDGIVMSLIRRCRSQSSSRSSRRRRRTDDDDDDDDDDDGVDDDVAEHIELCQMSGLALTRLSDLSDAGHKFVTVYVDVPVWCDHCGQLIIVVYGHYSSCQRECIASLSHTQWVILREVYTWLIVI